MTDSGSKDQVKPLVMPQVMRDIWNNGSTGVLKVEDERCRKQLFVHEGQVIFARSTLDEDRLGDILVAQGKISLAQYNEATKLIYEKGYRHGRALVEIKAISPKTLWSTIQAQIKSISMSVACMSSGRFEFLEKPLKQQENITLQLPLIDLSLEAVRGIEDRTVFRDRYPNLQAIWQRLEFRKNLLLKLEPYEELVLKKIDGEQPLSVVCRDNDLGVEESMRVFFILEMLGMIEDSGKVYEGEVSDLHPLLAKYNPMFEYLCGYLTERLGSVGSSLLAKFLEDVSKSKPMVLEGVTLTPKGGLNPGEVQLNLSEMPEEDIDPILEDALTEFLFASILAVKRALGSECEAEVIAHLDGFPKG